MNHPRREAEKPGAEFFSSECACTCKAIIRMTSRAIRLAHLFRGEPKSSFAGISPGTDTMTFIDYLTHVRNCPEQIFAMPL